MAIRNEEEPSFLSFAKLASFLSVLRSSFFLFPHVSIFLHRRTDLLLRKSPCLVDTDVNLSTVRERSGDFTESKIHPLLFLPYPDRSSFPQSCSTEFLGFSSYPSSLEVGDDVFAFSYLILLLFMGEKTSRPPIHLSLYECAYVYLHACAM